MGEVGEKSAFGIFFIFLNFFFEKNLGFGNGCEGSRERKGGWKRERGKQRDVEMRKWQKGEGEKKLRIDSKEGRRIKENERCIIEPESLSLLTYTSYCPVIIGICPSSWSRKKEQNRTGGKRDSIKPVLN